MQDRLALANWKNVVAGADGGGQAARQAAMPIRYHGLKVMTGLIVKEESISACREAIKKAPDHKDVWQYLQVYQTSPALSAEPSASSGAEIEQVVAPAHVPELDIKQDPKDSSEDEDLADIEQSDLSEGETPHAVEWVAPRRLLKDSKRHVVSTWGPDGNLQTALTLCRISLVEARNMKNDVQIVSLHICHWCNGRID